MTPTSSPATSATGPQGCRLWIDGVGCWQLWFADTLTLGGGAAGQPCEADFGIQAALSRRHCQVMRSGEHYQLSTTGPAVIDGQPVTENVFLSSAANIRLGNDVQLSWTRPSILSRSAVLRICSPHRPISSIDGVILLADTLLIGSGAGVHITCPRWTQPLVLFRRQDQLFCQPQPELELDGQRIKAPQPLTHGSLISIGELCARLEVVTP